MKIIINIEHLIKSELAKRSWLLFTFIIIATLIAKADTGRYRIMFGNDPSTEITIGFDAYATNTNPTLYYSTSPIDVNNLNNLTTKQTPNVTNTQYGMVNCFVQLTNLLPDQTYYFVIKDNIGISDEYNFDTIADNNDTELSIIAGGDSRNDAITNTLPVRAVANKIVSKLKAHALMFNGDLTDKRSNAQWQRWLDDWQLTISTSNRITPIIPARGNHENSNAQLGYLFDCPANMYYTNSLGSNLLEIYTLNSENPLSAATDQTTWLENKLANSSSIWKFAQYHKPIRPHVKLKKEGPIQYAYWANLFYQYEVDAVLEGDAHTVKTTWPIIPCSGGFDCVEGFKRDDLNGTVYLGEGSYAAPPRLNDDDKTWTRASGSFNQFKWIFVNKDEMEIRTVKYDENTNTDVINEVQANNRFTIPQNLDIWDPNNLGVLSLYKSTSNIPTCDLTIPNNNAMFFNFNNITISAEASASAGINEVKFYVNGFEEVSDNNAPYEFSWQPTSDGVYMVSAIAKDVNGLSSVMDFSVINVGPKNNIVHTALIDISSDEYGEYDNGTIKNDNYKVEIANPSFNFQGLRFHGINIPPNATIESASISFVSGSSNSDLANAIVRCEKSGNGLPFKAKKFNLSSRVKTDNSFNWAISSWTNQSIETTPDLSNVIQELVQLPDWTIESPVVFLISSTNGTRRAKSYASQELRHIQSVIPKLTVQFSIPDILGCTNPTACNYNENADVDDSSCLYVNQPCDDANANTINDEINAACTCIGEDGCPTDIIHSGNLTGGIYTVSNSIESTATITQSQRVDYDAGSYIHLDKGFLADSGEGVFLLAKIDGCTQLRKGNFMEQITSIKNYPNPFTGETTIEFEVNEQSTVSLIVTDIMGKVVATLLSESTKENGTHQLRFDGNNLAQGVYYCTLIANDKISTQKMMLMK